MNRFLFVLTFTSLTLCLAAQSGTPAKAEKNDPEAKKILDKIRKKYEGYKSVEVAFSLTVEVPESPKEVQKGTVAQEGAKFRLDMDQQTIVCDGKSTWVYLKNNNEVQINDADNNGAGEFMSPQDLLKRYEKGDFLYSVTDKTTEGGTVYTQIEFKPKDRNSEYSKLRLSVNAKANTLSSIKAFAKDGSRYTFAIKTLTPNKKFKTDHFTFDTKKYPGVKVEDLRM